MSGCFTFRDITSNLPTPGGSPPNAVHLRHECLKKLMQPETTPNQASPAETPEKKMKEERILMCRRCSHKITALSKAMAINGKHQHTFFNPAGILFEIGCFSSASGCRVEGLPTAEFSWFSGYLWSYSLCGTCLSHLGWFFQAGQKRSFFGLILNRLCEGST